MSDRDKKHLWGTEVLPFRWAPGLVHSSGLAHHWNQRSVFWRAFVLSQMSKNPLCFPLTFEHCSSSILVSQSTGSNRIAHISASLGWKFLSYNDSKLCNRNCTCLHQCMPGEGGGHNLYCLHYYFYKSQVSWLGIMEFIQINGNEPSLKDENIGP